jgi:hypothetical protein
MNRTPSKHERTSTGLDTRLQTTASSSDQSTEQSQIEDSLGSDLIQNVIERIATGCIDTDKSEVSLVISTIGASEEPIPRPALTNGLDIPAHRINKIITQLNAAGVTYESVLDGITHIDFHPEEIDAVRRGEKHLEARSRIFN